MMLISLNNQRHEIAAGTHLAQVLADYAPANSQFAVAINREFVPKSQYSQRLLQPDDQIDIVSPVGGG